MQPDIVQIASLIGDASRASMLVALLGGRALTATELAAQADISAQTASQHLTKLVSGQLLVVRKQGRHKYFQLKSIAVASLLEDMLNLSNQLKRAEIKTGPRDDRLRTSRICYDHLAGGQSVRLFDGLLAQQFIVENEDNVSLTALGIDFFEELKLDFTSLSNKRAVCKSCLDWSERRTHMAGSLGQWILSDLLERKWAVKDLDSRAIRFSTTGLSKFNNRYRLV
jgi:DNA-binding transcriptional ArsR family regulator